MLLLSSTNTAGTMMAVSTEIGIKSRAPLKLSGKLRGATPDSIMNRMAKVSKPVIIMMVQINVSPVCVSSYGVTNQQEFRQLLQIKARCSMVDPVQLEQ